MQDTESLASKWEVMAGQKGDLISRCEQYAMWTDPSICPQENEDGAEQSRGNVVIGARLVNHLANKVVDTMFPSDRPFFALTLTAEARMRLEKEQGEEKAAQFAAQLRGATSRAEEAAVRKLNLTAYRPVAIQAVMHQIVTGNAVILRLEDGARVVYGVKDFCSVRDIRGALKQLILRDSKKFDSLTPELQAALKVKRPELKAGDDVTLYTYFWLERKRWHTVQAVDEVEVPNSKKSYKPVDSPVLSLTWNLSRGENYGRGLVEAHAAAFHNIDVTTQALLDLIGIAADLKFLVDPASGIDIDELNEAARGAYLPGRKDDISTPDFPKRIEVQLLTEAIANWQRELSQAFLMQSGTVRDAERVTAEEIRFYARELESAYGGLYSKLALDWQKQEADYLISQIDFSVFDKTGVKTFDVAVTTGLESLSREGQLDALRLAIADLQMLEAVPEDVRAAINPRVFAEFVFTNRGVKLIEFLYSAEEMKANQEAQMAQQQQLLDAQARANVGEAAGKKAVES